MSILQSTSLYAILGVLAITPCAAQDAVTIELRIKDHRFQPASITASAGTPLVIKVTNEDATAEEFESSDLKVEKIVAPNSQITVKLKPQKQGQYAFHGEYNQETAKGTLTVE